MKLVVTGTPGDSSCSTSRSATKLASSWSEENRWKSSCCVGLGKLGATRGGSTSSNDAVALGPEGGPPRVVQPVDVAVPVDQPVAEGLGAHVAVAQGVVTAQLVAHVPQGQGLVAAVPLCHRPAQPQRVLPVDRRARAEGLPSARPQDGAVHADRKHLRMAPGEPRRRGRRRGGEVHLDARGVDEVDHLVEPAEGELAGARLQQGPGEDAHGDQVDAGLAHQPDVVLPHLPGPLLGVVVAAEGQGGE